MSDRLEVLDLSQRLERTAGSKERLHSAVVFGRLRLHLPVAVELEQEATKFFAPALNCVLCVGESE